MGTNCVVFLANFFLFTYEYEYILSLLHKHQWTQLRRLLFTKRYLDDIITLNNPTFNTYKYKIYHETTTQSPNYMLTLEEESTNLPMHCLDINLYYHEKEGYYATTLHTKKDDPKYKALTFTKYPHPHSYIAPTILYNTITTELHRYKNLNSEFDTFKTNTQTLINTCLAKQYHKKRVHNKIRAFIESNLPFYNYQSSYAPWHAITQQ